MRAMLGVIVIFIAMHARAQLVSTDGGLGVYDSNYNVTWAPGANLGTLAENYSGGEVALVSAVIAASGGAITDSTPNANVPPTYYLSASDFSATTGQMDWWGAQAWVHYLDVINYGGSNQWALPQIYHLNEEISPSASELSELSYELQASPSNLISLSGLWYWVSDGTVGCNGAWQAGGDMNDCDSPHNSDIALVVAPGNIGTVPAPASVWLMLSGLGGLGVMIRRRDSSRSLPHSS